MGKKFMISTASNISKRVGDVRFHGGQVYDEDVCLKQGVDKDVLKKMMHIEVKEPKKESKKVKKEEDKDVPIEAKVADAIKEETKTDLTKISKDELESYCKKKYAFDLDKRLSKAKLVKKIGELGG